MFNLETLPSLDELTKQLMGVDFSKEIIIDVETTSYSDTEGGFNPWGGHRVTLYIIKPIGLPAIPVPVRHGIAIYSKHLYPVRETCGMLADWATHITKYVNANPKFDMRMAARGDGILLCNPNLRVYDTQVLGRAVKNDLHTYSLENLCEFFGVQAKKGDIIQQYLEKTQDYGKIPLDVLIEYGIGDVESTEALYVKLMGILRERDTKGVLFKKVEQ